MKIFVVGCSYTNWSDSGDQNPGSTWPALLAQSNTDDVIVDCSYPGLSNNAYFFRLQQAENSFGKADKVIVQWTLPYRDFYILKDDYESVDWMQIHNNYFCNHFNKNDVWIKLRPQQDLDYASEMLNVPKKIIAKYVATWLDSPNVKYHFEREFKLINSYYGKDNVLNYLHVNDKIFQPYIENMYGCAKDSMPSFENFRFDFEGHLTIQGHKKLYKWLTPGITNLLAKGNK